MQIFDHRNLSLAKPSSVSDVLFFSLASVFVRGGQGPPPRGVDGIKDGEDLR